LIFLHHYYNYIKYENNISSFIIHLLFSTAFAQIQVDKRIELISSGSDAKITGIDEVSQAKDAVSAGVLQSGALIKATAVSGNTTITLSFTPAITAATLISGTTLVFQAAGNNLGPVTIDVDGAGVLPPAALLKQISQPLASGDIQSGEMVQFTYDGANFQLLNAPGTGVTGNGVANRVAFWSGTNSLNSMPIWFG
jgi:hypothetical protein